MHAAPTQPHDPLGRTICGLIGITARINIDGLRPPRPIRHGVDLICGHGYRVRVIATARDTYSVLRLHVHGATETIKGARTGVAPHQLSEVAYRAGMFQDPWPEGGIPYARASA